MVQHVHEVTNKDDFATKLAEAGNKLVVVDFTATWCGPCRKISPQIHSLAQELEGKVVFLAVDVDKCSDITEQYNVDSMPTFVFIKDSKTLDKFSGANIDKVKEYVAKHS